MKYIVFLICLINIECFSKYDFNSRINKIKEDLHIYTKDSTCQIYFIDYCQVLYYSSSQFILYNYVYRFDSYDNHKGRNNPKSIVFNKINLDLESHSKFKKLLSKHSNLLNYNQIENYNLLCREEVDFTVETTDSLKISLFTYPCLYYQDTTNQVIKNTIKIRDFIYQMPNREKYLNTFLYELPKGKYDYKGYIVATHPPAFSKPDTTSIKK